MCIKQTGLGLLLLVSSPSLKCQPQQQCDPGAVVQNVENLLEKKNFAEAGKRLDEFQGCLGRSALNRFQMGWLYGRARRFDTALQTFSSVPADVPDNLTHDYAVALSKFELTQYQGAIDVLKPHQQSGTADTKTINLLAVSYSKLGEYREAYSVLAAQAQKDPADLALYLNLVTVAAEGGDFARAAEVAGQAASLFPKSADVFIVKGAADTLLGHLDQAYNEFAEGAHLAPERADARFFLALVNYKRGKFFEAINILQTASKDGIADPDLHYLMAECLLKSDPANTVRALGELDRAIALNSNSVSARTLRGKLLLEAGHLNQAKTDLELASHRDPESRTTLYNLARVYQALGRSTEAKTLFRQIRTQTVTTMNEFSDKRLNEALTDDTTRQ